MADQPMTPGTRVRVPEIDRIGTVETVNKIGWVFVRWDAPIDMPCHICGSGTRHEAGEWYAPEEVERV